jgi:hypothetical protein
MPGTTDRENLDRCHMLDAGVVDQDVDAAEFLRSGCDQRGNLSRLAHVGRRIVHGDAVLPFQADTQSLDLVFVAEAVEHEVDAPFRQCPRDAKPDPRRRAGHDCIFPFH